MSSGSKTGCRVTIVTAAMMEEIPELSRDYGLGVGDLVTEEGGIPVKTTVARLCFVPKRLTFRPS